MSCLTHDHAGINLSRRVEPLVHSWLRCSWSLHASSLLRLSWQGADILVQHPSCVGATAAACMLWCACSAHHAAFIPAAQATPQPFCFSPKAACCACRIHRTEPSCTAGQASCGHLPDTRDAPMLPVTDRRLAGSAAPTYVAAGGHEVPKGVLAGVDEDLPDCMQAACLHQIGAHLRGQEGRTTWYI